MTLTTYDENLCRKIEPNVSTTKEHFEVLKKVARCRDTNSCMADTDLPSINDSEDNASGILNKCIDAKVYGIICFGMGLTLRDGNPEYFYEHLDGLFPG